MNKIIIRKIQPYLPQFLFRILKAIHNKYTLNRWYRNGCKPPAPHVIKQRIIKEYQNKYQYNILIETGTFKGDMVEAQRKNFKVIYSIELSMDLYNKAKQRFKNFSHINIIQGDSGKVLPTLLESINEPVIFWLDGHYSSGITAKGEKNCPIFEEVDAIFQKNTYNHILLIDDARCFNGKDDYPTIDELTEFIKKRNSKYTLYTEYDVIRYVIKN